MNENEYAPPRSPAPPVEPSPDEDLALAPIEIVPDEIVEPPPQRRRWVLPLVLFLATCVSTYVGYWLYFGNGSGRVPGALVYSLCVMTILTCHEAGHFIQARRYGVRASLPIFLPMPFTPLGTLGAVIAMDSRVADRKALFDIGITGPLAGLVPTLVFCILGLQFNWSKLAPMPPELLQISNPFVFGEPLLFRWLSWLTFGARPEGYDVFIGPMAFAGWVGLLITALNLIPIGQLDGGHILYALFRRRAHVIASTVLAGAVVGTLVFGFYGWWLMLVLLILMGPKHPPTSNDSVPLGKARLALGWAMLAFLPLGFTPNPFPGLDRPDSEPPAMEEEQSNPLPRPRPFHPPPSDDQRWV